MNESVGFIALILAELVLAGGLVWAWKKLGDLQQQLSDGHDLWLNEIRQGRVKMREFNTQLTNMKLDSWVAFRPTSWKGRLAWLALQRAIGWKSLSS